MRVRIRRFDRLVPPIKLAGWVFAVWGRRGGFTSHVSIRRGLHPHPAHGGPPKRDGECSTLIETQALLILPIVRAFAACAATMPSADFCPALERLATFPVTQDGSGRSPEVSSTAFDAQPPDLPPVPLMDMGFAVICQLTRHRRPRHPVFVHRLAPLLHASFRPRLTTTPLRFAMTSPPSGCQRDFHPQAVEHARHTKKTGDLRPSLQMAKS